MTPSCRLPRITGCRTGAPGQAVAALEAAATGDIKPSLAALARVTQQCVACHSAYRVQ